MSNIITGFKNYFNNISSEEIKSKSEICLQCKEIDDTLLLKVLKDITYPKLTGKKCKKCGCFLSAKLRSDSKCPLNKF